MTSRDLEELFGARRVEDGTPNHANLIPVSVLTSHAFRCCSSRVRSHDALSDRPQRRLLDPRLDHSPHESQTWWIPSASRRPRAFRVHCLRGASPDDRQAKRRSTSTRILHADLWRQWCGADGLQFDTMPLRRRDHIPPVCFTRCHQHLRRPGKYFTPKQRRQLQRFPSLSSCSAWRRRCCCFHNLSQFHYAVSVVSLPEKCRKSVPTWLTLGQTLPTIHTFISV